MFTVSKETTSSSVSHSLAKGEITPGSLRIGFFTVSCWLVLGVMEDWALPSDIPHILLVSGREMEVHSSLPALGKILLFPCGLVVTIESEAERLQPSQSITLILLCSLLGDNTLDDHISVPEEVVTPVPMLVLLLRHNSLGSVDAGGGHSEFCEAFKFDQYGFL